MKKIGDYEKSNELKLIEAARAQESPSSDVGSWGGARLDVTTAPDLPQDAFGGYEIVREYHRGGQGVVYEAIQEGTQRRVAIKIMREGPLAGRRARARFEREAEILGSLKHPNIVTIHHSGKKHGCFYFVMDLVQGVPLDRFLQDRKPTLKQAMELFVKICDAVHAAHLNGVIHRDLKPSNLYVQENGEPQILDFGLAKFTGNHFTETASQISVTEDGRFMGSLPWASPEQIRGRSDEIDLRTDVYSLGVILYQMLTRKFPYPVDSDVRTVLSHIAETNPPRPSSIRKELDQDLDAITLKCLSKEPSRRYQSVLAVSEDIRRYLANEPVAARAPSSIYQLKKLISRHKLPCVFALTLLVLIVGFAACMSVLYRRAAEARDRAVIAEQEAEREARTTQTINEFLVHDLLASSDPEMMAGHTVGVIDVLHNAAQTVGTKLADQPVLQASVRVVIGQSYLSLGVYDDAEAQFRVAEEIRQSYLGDEDPATLEVRVKLVEVLRRQDRIDEAESLCIETYETCSRILGPENAETMEVASHRAWFHWYRGDAKVGDDLYQQTLDTARRVLGHDDRLTVTLMNARGAWAYHVDELAEAEDVYHEALSRAEKVLGPDHPQTLTAMTNLGLLLTSRRKFPEAEPLLRNAMDSLNSSLHDHAATVESMIKYSVLLREASRLDEAESLLREAVDMAIRVVGEDHSTTHDAMQALANTMMRQGQWEEAIRLGRDLLETDLILYGYNDPHTANELDGLGLVLLRLGRYAEAEERLREANEINQWKRPPQHHVRAGNLRRLAQSLAAQGKLAEARPFAEQMLAIRRYTAEETLPTAYKLNCYAWDLLSVEPEDLRDPALALEVALRAFDLSSDEYHYNRYTLGLAYHANGDVEQAIELVNRALRATPVEISEDRMRYESFLVKLLEEKGELDAAEQVYRDTLERRRQVFPEDHLDIAGSLDDLGFVLLRHEKYDEAESVLRECLEIRRRNLPREGWCFARTSCRLGAALARQQRFDEAEPLLLDAYDRLRENNFAPLCCLTELLDTIMNMYESAGRPNEAEIWRNVIDTDYQDHRRKHIAATWSPQEESAP